MFGDRLKQVRTQNELTQAELAKKLGISTSAIGMYEQNRREPSADIILKILDIFGLSSDWLLYGRETTLKQNTMYNTKTEDFSIIIDDLKQQLISQKGLMFNGEILNDKDIEKIFTAMKLGAKLAVLKDSNIDE